jgi:hypothetical protein
MSLIIGGSSNNALLNHKLLSTVEHGADCALSLDELEVLFSPVNESGQSFQGWFRTFGCEIRLLLVG